MYCTLSGHSSNDHSSTQIFIVRPNTEIGTDVLRLDVVLPSKVGHEHRIIICVALVSIPAFDRTTIATAAPARRERGRPGE